MNVSQLMTRNLVTCRPEDRLTVAARAMWENDIGCVVVVDGEGHAVGVLTDRDVCMAAYLQGRRLDGITAGSAMSKELYGCLPSDSLLQAEEVMRSRRVRRMPVIDAEGHPVGIVTLNDLARQAVREQGRKGRQISTDEITTTLAAVCEPRRSGALVTVA